jgi:hypothetical protein
MITNLQVITDALRLINVISEVDTPSAEQGQHALRVLNQMIESWTEDGVELGFFAQESTADDCPIPPKSELAVTTILATTLATTYGATVSQELGVAAVNAYSTLLREAVKAQMHPADMTNLPTGEGHSGWVDQFE